MIRILILFFAVVYSSCRHCELCDTKWVNINVSTGKTIKGTNLSEEVCDKDEIRSREAKTDTTISGSTVVIHYTICQ